MGEQIRQIVDRFVNMYLIVEADGITLVDAGTNTGVGAVQRALAAGGHRLEDVRRILITHCDPDHVGSAGALRALTGARLYAGAVEAAAMREGRPSRDIRGGRVTSFLFGLSRFIMPMAPAEADEMLADGMRLPVLGGLEVIATPGHTPGHLSLFAPAHGVLFAGDSLRATKGGLRCDDAPVMWSYERARESARRQAALGARMVCCGHGPVLEGAAASFPGWAR